MTQLRKKDIGKPGNGGQFAGHRNSDPYASLVSRQELSFDAPALLDFSIDPLRFPFPELGEPTLRWGTDENTGRPFVSVEVGGFDALVVRHEYDGWGLPDSDTAEFPIGTTDEDKQEAFDVFSDWACELASRIYVNDSRYVDALRGNPEINAQILAAALGKPVPQVDQRAAEDARAMEIITSNYTDLDELQEAIDTNNITAEDIVAMLRAAQR